MIVGILAATAIFALPATSGAQSFDAVGTRADSMGGAFVAVADDASAAYWNPAGFATGSFFSMVIDRITAKVDPGGNLGAGSQSGLFVGLGLPAIGLSYYRLRAATLDSVSASNAGLAGGRNITGPEIRLDTLVTHHAGVTLLQTVVPGVTVGATVKLVRGIASSTIEPDGNRDLLDQGSDQGRAGIRFDADLGAMAALGKLKAGLTVRNLSEPAFKTPGDARLKLERQARAGVSVTPVDGWTVAADLDLLKTRGPLGALKEFAAGTEAKVAGKAFVRGGLHVNTVGERGTTVTGGASYAATATLLLDAQVSGGGERAAHGWGVSARFVY
jgi:hypothetical protein